MSTSVLTLSYTNTLPVPSSTTNVNYNVTLANDTGTISIPVTDHDVSTSLDLFGKQSTEYGQGFWANMIHLLENFNNEKEPRNPIVGQLWYTGKKLLICTKHPTTLLTDTDYITKPKTFSSGAEWSEIVANPTVISPTGTPTAAFTLDKTYVDNRSITADTAPTLTNDDTVGKLWYDTNDNVCKILVLDSGNKVWKSINSVTVSSTSPGNNTIGQLWYDSTNSILKISNGFIKDSSGNPTTQIDWLLVANPIKKLTVSNKSSAYTLTATDLGQFLNLSNDITLSNMGEGFYCHLYNKTSVVKNITWSTPLIITVNGDTTAKTSPVTLAPKTHMTVYYTSNTEILLK